MKKGVRLDQIIQMHWNILYALALKNFNKVVTTSQWKREEDDRRKHEI